MVDPRAIRLQVDWYGRPSELACQPDGRLCRSNRTYGWVNHGIWSTSRHVFFADPRTAPLVPLLDAAFAELGVKVDENPAP